MGMFGNLMNKIFRAGADAERPVDVAQPGVKPESQVTARKAATGAFGGAGAGGGGGGTGTVDVAANLDAMAASNNEKLDWKHSIVDLMKLVGMDSSMTARKELADELGYKGDKNDSATMNIWLHKEVMKKLAANGGKVPADLLD